MNRSAIRRIAYSASVILLATLPAAGAPAASPEVIAAHAEMNQTGPAPVFLGSAVETGEVVTPPPILTFWNLILLAAAIFGLWLFIDRGWHRLSRPPPRPLAFSGFVGVALLFGVMILAPLGVITMRAALGIDPEQTLDVREMALLAIGLYAAETIIVLIYFALVMSARRPRPDRRFGNITAAFFGVAALFLFWLFAISASWLVNVGMHLLGAWSPDPIAHETLLTLVGAERTVWFFIMVGLVILVAPIFEEAIYRGLLQELLGRITPRWIAIAATSAVFMLMHAGAAPTAEAIPPLFAALFVLSLGFGWAYEKTGRLAAPITMHILFNAGNLAAAMWMG